MIGETRNPILLTVAAVLSLCALIAYTIGDLKEKSRRQEVIQREQGASRAQNVQLIQERARQDSRNERETQEWAELRNQFNTIIHSLQRIEKTVQSSSR